MLYNSSALRSGPSWGLICPLNLTLESHLGIFKGLSEDSYLRRRLCRLTLAYWLARSGRQVTVVECFTLLVEAGV